MKKILLISIIFLFSFNAESQYGGSRYIGFNTNPILSQVIPFNHINPLVTNASIMVRSYNARDNGVRAGYGVSLGSESEIQTMFFSIENDWRRQLNGRFTYFNGFGAILKLINDPNTTGNEETSLGLGWHWGIEYSVNEIFSLSTEASLRFGTRLEDGGAFFKLDPPINIIAHFNIYK